jgi:hypothetical protein
MPVPRRRFLELTALGAAGCLAGACRSTTDRPEIPVERVTLNLTLHGAFLYAVSEHERRVEVACLTDPPAMPCDAGPVRPILTLLTGAAIDAASDVKPLKDGEVPRGAYRLDAGRMSAPAAQLVGLHEIASACPTEIHKIRSLAHVPELRTSRSRVASNWRDRFATRFRFDAGELRASAPLRDPEKLPRWSLVSPTGDVAGPFPLTDTLRLTVSLPSPTATFVDEEGRRLIIRPAPGTDTIEARLDARTAADTAASGAAEALCALYAVFEPVPPPDAQDRLVFRDWCAEGDPAPGGGPTAAMPAGDFRPGALVRI